MLRNLLFILLFLLSGCSNSSTTQKDVQYVKDPFNPNRVISKTEADRIGKLDLFSRKSNKNSDEYTQKNYFLWSACVDVLSDMPTKVSDALGGIYTTEFVLDKTGIKKSVQCRVVGDKILSSNLDVTIFRMTSDNKNLEPISSNELKSNILIRARELKAQHDSAKI